MSYRSSQTAERPPLSAFIKLVTTEAKLTLRTPLSVILGLVLPALLLVIFGAIPAFSKPVPQAGGATVISLYGPILSVFVLAMLAFTIFPATLATYREQGTLRRMSCTPAPPSWLLGAQLVVNLTVAALALVIINVGVKAYGVKPPQQVGGFILSVIVCTAMFFAIGLCIAAVVRGAGSANAIGGTLFYPMMFFAGLYFPRDVMPSVLRHISDWTPGGAGVSALQRAAQGSFPSAQSLLVMAGYALLLGFIAVRRFKWE